MVLYCGFDRITTYSFLYYNVGEEDDGYEDSNEIVTRTQFPESWLWKDVSLPKCDVNSPNW